MQKNSLPAEPYQMKPSKTANLSSEKNLEAMKNFSETYAKRTGTYFCVDPSVTAVVIEGLAKHKDELGAPLCPCRHYEDKEAEVKAAYWNCPCIPMRERKDCHCMLFLTPDNEFAGEQQDIAIEEIQAVRDSLA
jgi:ferredoxin-thioredoxin reductase catalytic chain